MKVFIRGTLAALAVALVGAVGAEAQIAPTDIGWGAGESWDLWSNHYLNAGAADYPTGGGTGVACDAGGDAAAFGAVECAGSFFKNDEGEGADPGRAAVEAFIQGQWGGGVNGSYVGDVMGDTGGLFGDFVLAVKGGNWFSLYYFEGWDGSTIDVNMAGVAPQQGISHVSLYDVQYIVPEPGTLLLLATGLLGLAATRRREELPC